MAYTFDVARAPQASPCSCWPGRFQQAAMATAAVITIAIGLITAIPTIITGLGDLL
jgi:hypothetical protein